MKVIIVGAGNVGYHVAHRLSRENKEVVVIDKDQDAIRRITDTVDAQGIIGSGGSPLVLEKAGLREAELFMALTDSDEINLLACLSADLVSPTSQKIARIRSTDYDLYLEAFRLKPPHIGTIINPDVEVVKTIDRMIEFPGAVDINEFAEGRIKFVGIRLDEGARLTGISLSSLSSQMNHKMPLITAIIRNDQLIIPRGTDTLKTGDLIYFVSESSQLQKTLSFFEKFKSPVRRAMIIGGGRIGSKLARLFETKDIATKLIEKNQNRCNELAEMLGKTVVINGNGTDRDILVEENVHDMDIVACLTDDEGSNIVSSLLVKHMGAKMTITRVSKFGYFPLMGTIGLDHVINPGLSAINTILQHVRRGKILSAQSIKGEQAEIMEAVAMETSDIVGCPIKSIKFPKGALVAAIVRQDEVIIPTGNSVIMPGDRIIIFARRTDIQLIEKILSVKLEFI